jgi:hypothetical protein
MPLRALTLVFWLRLAAVVSAQSTIDTPHDSELRGAGWTTPQLPLGTLLVPMQTPGFGGQDRAATRKLAERASAGMTCGPKAGPCAEGLCCSPHGISQMPSVLSVY